MKKTYKVEVDCAVCAAKMEDCIKNIEGVDGCTVNFMTQKLIIEADKEKQKEILEEAIKRVAKVDDDIVIHA